jgi:hypothetical protein
VALVDITSSAPSIRYLVDDRRGDVVVRHDTQGVTDPVRHCVASPRIVDRGAGLRDNGQHLHE